MSISSTPEITILPETTDPRPEPPKMPDLWVVRSLLWLDDDCGWVPILSTSYRSEQSAQEAASRCVARGKYRRVQVIKIGGDA